MVLRWLEACFSIFQLVLPFPNRASDVEEELWFTIQTALDWWFWCGQDVHFVSLLRWRISNHIHLDHRYALMKWRARVDSFCSFSFHPPPRQALISKSKQSTWKANESSCRYGKGKQSFFYLACSNLVTCLFVGVQGHCRPGTVPHNHHQLLPWCNGNNARLRYHQLEKLW